MRQGPCQSVSTFLMLVNSGLSPPCHASALQPLCWSPSSPDTPRAVPGEWARGWMEGRVPSSALSCLGDLSTALPALLLDHMAAD